MNWRIVKKVVVVIAPLAGLATIFMLLHQLLGINALVFALGLLKYRIPAWATSLLVIACVFIWRFSTLLRKRSGNVCTAVFRDYGEEVFEEKLYRWEYVSIGNRYAIGKIWALCLQCKCQIVDAECRICRAMFIDMMDRPRAKAMIEYSIENKFGANAARQLEIDENV